MARSSDFSEAKDMIGATASAVTSQARRAARAATSEAARSVRHNSGAIRTVFHDLADEAEERSRQAARLSSGFGEKLMRQSKDQPAVTVAVLAATAVLTAALVTWFSARR